MADNKKKTTTFNPVKEETSGKQARRMIWSSESLALALKGLEAGRKLIANPFYENNTRLLKGDLVFERTQEEIDEWVKCSQDIEYFANKYCKLMTPEGVQHITLRDYQMEYLKHLEAHRLSIMVSCRQAGKCLSNLSVIQCVINENFFKDLEISGDKLKKYFDDNFYIKEEDCYSIPLFELINCYNKSFTWKLEYRLYKLLYRLEKWKRKRNSKEEIISLIYKCIELLDKRNNQEDKLVWSHLLNGIQIKSESGWSPASYIHITKPFQVYHIETKSGLVLDCADEHILFDDNFNTIYTKDLHPGSIIQTEFGLDEISSIEVLNRTISMGDITVLNDNESYYSNHILSHNTTTSAIFMLHYILFNTDKNALVLGDKRKTSVEILNKVKSIFYELPYWIKPGVYKWNEGEIVLDNGCRCMAEATTVNSGISFTFHCILADEFSKIAKNIQEPFYNHVFPTVIAANARFMISSTVNLDNPKDLFYRLLTAAKNGDNDYAPFEVTWDRVPDWDPDHKCWVKRDERWHQRMIANYGSEEAFEGQFGIGFEYTTNSIIASEVLKKKKSHYVNFINKDLYGVPNSDKYFWKPDYEPMEMLKRDYIVTTTDLSEGLGGNHDDTVVIFNKVYAGGKTECVGYFKARDVDREAYALSHVMLYALYCNPNRLLVSFEKNTYGDLYLQHMMNYVNNDQRLGMRFDTGCFVKYYNETGTKWVHGIKMTPSNKGSHCILFKEDYERGTVVNESQVFYDQIVDFADNGHHSYAATNGNHDDIPMAQIQIEFVKETLQFKNMISEIPTEEPGVNQKEEEDSTLWNPFDNIPSFAPEQYEYSSNLSRLNGAYK